MSKNKGRNKTNNKRINNNGNTGKNNIKSVVSDEEIVKGIFKDLTIDENTIEKNNYEDEKIKNSNKKDRVKNKDKDKDKVLVVNDKVNKKDKIIVTDDKKMLKDKIVTTNEIDSDNSLIDEFFDNIELLEERNINSDDIVNDTDTFDSDDGTKGVSLFNKGLANKTIWLIIIILVIIAFLIYKFLLMPQIDLHGSKKLIIDYKANYKEKGFNASFLGEDITDDVIVSGKVDSSKIGTYEIVYTVKHGIFKTTKKRIVEVKDISAPKLSISDGDIFVCPKKKAQKEKVEAIDNVDGDISSKIKVTEKDDEIIYEVTDKAGNSSKVIKKIKYVDKEKPVINLNGGDVIYTFVGEDYKKANVSASDNCDGDITNKITVTDNVNSSIVGEYEIKYEVSDSVGNVTNAVSKVIVAERGRNGTIYLTFDDGPKAGTTDVILDILKEEGIKATFFVTNGGPDYLIKRAYDEGHSIALHTASHNYGVIYRSVDDYFNDLNIVSNRVKRITGVESKIIRFPGGSSNTISRRYNEGIMSNLTGEVLRRGYRYYDWNISSGDAEYGRHTGDEIANNVISSLSKNKVNMVLMHDIKTYTRDGLRQIISYGKENGYVFDSITDSTEMITQRVNN